MRKTKALIAMNIILIILSAILLVLVFIDGIRGDDSVSNILIFFAMILNIANNIRMLNKNAHKYMDETRE